MPPMTGRVIAGRYNLQTPIGRGAMGVVWRARDELLDREVAIKEVVISALIGADERRNAYQRTLREARTAARLSHRGVVTVYDVVEEDSRPWIVMELVPSQSLDQVLTAEGRLPAGRACRIGQQLLSALAAAHAAGVLHRDVKPSNVLISASRTGDGWDERAVLTDFGIAQFEGDPRLTQTGMVMGSPGFTAPERIRGGDATPGSDLWSLGATIYAAVEGRGPYEQRGGAITTMSAIINEDAPVAPHGGRLAPLIAALLRRDPSSRPSASAAARLFASVLPHLTESPAEPPARPHPATALVSYMAPNATAAPPRQASASPASGQAPAGKPASGKPVSSKAAPASPPSGSPPSGSPASAASTAVTAESAAYAARAADDTSAGSDAGAGNDAAAGDGAAAVAAAAAGGAARNRDAVGGAAKGSKAEGAAVEDAEDKAKPGAKAKPGDRAKPADKTKPGSETKPAAKPEVSAEAGAGAEPAAGTDAARPVATAGREDADADAETGAEPAAAAAAAAELAAAAGPVPADVTVAVPAVSKARAKEAAPAKASREETAVADRDSIGYQPTQLAIPTQPKPPPPPPKTTPQKVTPPKTAVAQQGAPRKAAAPPRPTFTAAARQVSGYPPPSGAQHPPAASQYGGPSQSYPDLAGQYPPGSGGGRAASSGGSREASPGDGTRPRRRRRYALAVAAAVLVAAAAGVGAALALNSPGGTPHAAASGSTAPPVPDVVNQFKSVNALNDPSGVLPTGWTAFSHSATDLGTTAGFSIDLPPGWKETRDGQRTLYSGPGNLLLKVDLTPQPLSDMLAAATSVEKQSLAKRLLPGYQRVNLLAEPVRNTSGAVWKYNYELGRIPSTVDDILFAQQTPAGPQDYAIYLRAPKASFNGSALTTFDKILRTFETVPGTRVLPPVPSPAAS